MTEKTLTFIEMDLDLFRATRFEDVGSGVNVRNWSKAWSANTTMQGVLDNALPNGRAARIVRTGGLDQPTLWNWTLIPAMGDCSTLAQMRVTGTSASMGIALRSFGAAGNENGYILLLSSADYTIAQYTAGSFTTPAPDVAFTWTPGDLIWMRFDAINIAGGVLLRGKVWKGELSDEPPLFTVSLEDLSSLFDTPGGVGVYMLTADNVLDVCYFRARSLFADPGETLRHAIPTSYLPVKTIPSTPDIVSVSLSPPRLSVGGDLGKRSQLTVTFKDHQRSDQGESTNVGSHWGTFRARQLFRRGRNLRYITGLLGQELADMETRHYICESFSGPSRDGLFTVIAQDVLKLADTDRAQAPRLNSGSLLAAITNSDTALTLSPSGIGNLEYPASGIANIGGKEIVTFTRSGDAVTITARAQFNTEAVAHDAEDRFQTCLFFDAVDPATIIRDLFQEFSEINGDYVDYADWLTEVNTHLARLYTRLIPEPTSVNKLVSELIEQAGLALWSDDIAKKIRLQVIRGIPSTAFLFDDTNTLVGSIQPQEQPSKQVTEVWTYYGTRNPLEPLDDPNNFRNARVLIDEETETFQEQAIVKKIFATWIPSFADDTADRVNTLQIGRYSKAPRLVRFTVMRNSGVTEPQLGGGYRLSWSGNQDEAGAQIPTPIQVTSVNPKSDVIEIEAEEMLFLSSDPADNTDRVITISTPENNVFLPALHNSIYPEVTADDVTNGVNLTVIIPNGVIIGSNSVSSPSFNVGDEGVDWPTGFPITLVVESSGVIVGAGGHGGDFTTPGPLEGVAGGTCIFTRHPVSIDNQGVIGGGGGGGGEGVSGVGIEARGGGGAGSVAGLGGTVGLGGANGQNGSTFSGGLGGSFSGTLGGKGGDLGQAGDPGSGSGTSAAGGAAGDAIDGISFVTFINEGDVRGPQV